ncbi:hypothetical protein CLSAB_19640 [Clostridium saccharobutylicum]|uniref:DUF1540 domain-containing protein n=1 Tax=Clostridium saccharobutylicum TaxID=169679 RepID=UPI00098C710E|nr:DUF1540 domain-containing protein [Clostridium saccharobutylicum]OOM17244.1 hypothetical protein CLSAB_19640 [Clostridium saccharobutylicum]
MCKVMCNAKTCKNYKNGACGAETISIKDFTWYSEEDKEDIDEMKCSNFEWDKDWMLKPVAI